jgi:hypothetical protein
MYMTNCFIGIIILIIIIGLLLWYKYSIESFSTANTTISIPNTKGSIISNSIINGEGIRSNLNPDGSITIYDSHGNHIYTSPPSNNPFYKLSLNDQGVLSIIDSSGSSKTINIPK